MRQEAADQTRAALQGAVDDLEEKRIKREKDGTGAPPLTIVGDAGEVA